MTEEGLEVVSTGQLLIRNICMCFDVYLRNKARQQQFSRRSKPVDVVGK